MSQKQPEPSPYRYVNLALFLLAGCCNSVAAQAFTAIGPIIRNLYEVTQLQVSMNGMIYSIMYPLVIFPTNYLIETYGIKIGMLIGEMFLVLGLLIRLLINQSFWWFLVGTAITGFGFCFMINSPNKFVVNWFPVNQITLMNSICIFSIFMSDSLGTFASAAFIDGNSGKKDVFNFFMFESAAIVSILILKAIFFRGMPQKPPNYASQAIRQSYIPSLKKLLKTKNYLKLFFSMTFVFGALNVFFVCISWILEAYSFQSLQVGIIFIIANISGLFGCVITGYLFTNKNYRRNCILYIYLDVIAMFIMFFGMETHQSSLLYIGGGFFGFFVFPYLTTMTDFASQTAFPVGEAISGGFLLSGGQILGVLCSLLLNQLLFDGKSKAKTRIGFGVIISVVLIGVVFLHFSKPILLRSKYEQAKIKSDITLLTEDSYLDELNDDEQAEIK